MPTRVHITWSDPNTLHLDTDWGQQSRVFHFENMPMMNSPGADGAPGPGAEGTADAQPASLQGYSVAMWQRTQRQAAAFGGARVGPTPEPGGDLKVVTTHLAPAWLRRNGVPYGSHTVLTEYYQTFQDPLNRTWFDVTTQVVDPEYLMAPFITSSDFRHEPDGSHWAPHPCNSSD
jgi:hypothetical protein